MKEDSIETAEELSETPQDSSAMRKKIFELQTSSALADQRTVLKTVMAQVLLSDSRREKEKQLGLVDQYSPVLLRNLRQYLDEVSGIEFPPALSAVAGLGTEPYRLYRSTGFDKLHVLEHGLYRQVADEAYKAFDTAPAYYGLGKGEIASIANQRILDAPRSAKLTKFAPFRVSSSERQAGVSGKLRRELTPFLWYSLMGVSRTVCPDEDPLVQVLLGIDNMQKRLFGVNKSLSTSKRSLKSLQELQAFCFEVGKDASEVLGVPVNTKVHRIMRHVLDHFISFGCLRKGATDENETLHKTTKKGYSATNQHLAEIAPQLLSARIGLDAQTTRNSDGSQIREALLLTRDAIAVDNMPDVTYLTRCAPFNAFPVTEMSRTLTNFGVGNNIEDIESAVLKQVHPSTLTATWVKVKSVKFLASFSWMRSHKVIQTVYAGKGIYGIERRNDAVKYKREGRSEHGIIQSIYSHTDYLNSKVLLVRRLQEVEAERGNLRIVNKFGIKRFGYVLSNQDVVLDAIGPESLLRLVMLVPDPYLVSRIYGRKQRMNKIPDDISSREKMKFLRSPASSLLL